MKYTTEDFSTELSADEYVRRFRDIDRFAEYCRQCHNYGRSWACPPFGHDIDGELHRYRKVKLFATKITPADRNIPLSDSRVLIRPERERLEKHLLDMEAVTGGRAFTFVGNCLYCPEGTCTRQSGLPCRHPDKVRPSLEAYGFDVGLTLSELFGIKLLWSEDGYIPEYLTLVGGLFHN